MYTTDKCYFCGSELFHGACSDDPCKNKYYYSVIGTFNEFNFYLGHYLIRVQFKDNFTEIINFKDRETPTILYKTIGVLLPEQVENLINRVNKLNFIKE